MLKTILLIYIIAISVISVIVCCYDKFAAKHITKHRTRESSLLLFSALGGSVAMLITMFIIRHKTKHAKFMIGIPVIILIQAAAVFFVLQML
ncbi:MAG: DUF1294 domain-containing protein [Clostridia bacterium]|nr:DUF1294 domain-containing protein [Clostridia bacterium]